MQPVTHANPTSKSTRRHAHVQTHLKLCHRVAEPCSSGSQVITSADYLPSKQVNSTTCMEAVQKSDFSSPFQRDSRSMSSTIPRHWSGRSVLLSLFCSTMYTSRHPQGLARNMILESSIMLSYARRKCLMPDSKLRPGAIVLSLPTRTLQDA